MIQSTLKTDQLTQERVVSAVGFVAVLPSEQRIQSMIRIQRIVIAHLHLDAATQKSRAGDLDEITRRRLTMLMQICQTLADQVSTRKLLQRDIHDGRIYARASQRSSTRSRSFTASIAGYLMRLGTISRNSSLSRGSWTNCVFTMLQTSCRSRG